MSIKSGQLISLHCQIFLENYSISHKINILYNLCNYLLVKSFGSYPRFSPRMVIRVPGGPSLGETPVTLGGTDFLISFIHQLCFLKKKKKSIYEWNALCPPYFECCIMSTLVLALYVNLSFSAVCRPNLFIDKLILIEY